MKNQSEALEHASVRQYCRAVRVPPIGANFVSLAEQAVKENHTHLSASQRTAVEQTLATQDKIVGLEGVAGAGDTAPPARRWHRASA